MSCTCNVPHIDAINSFIGLIIESCRITTTVHVPHTNSTVKKVKVGPGWDHEAYCALEESLFSRRRAWNMQNLAIKIIIRNTNLRKRGLNTSRDHKETINNYSKMIHKSFSQVQSIPFCCSYEIS